MPDRFTVALSAAALASVAFLAACGSDATEPNEVANTRFVNASATTSSISATNEGRVVASGLAFQNTNQPSSCSTVEHGGDEEVKFTLGGTTNEIGSVKAEFISQANYSVVFYAPNTIAVYPDNFTAPGTGLNALRFINATGSAGDIYVTGPNDGISGAPAVANLGSNSVSGKTGGTPAMPSSAASSSDSSGRTNPPGIAHEPSNGECVRRTSSTSRRCSRTVRITMSTATAGRSASCGR